MPDRRLANGFPLESWVRLGPALFRARELTIGQDRATLVTVVRNGGVIDAIEDLEQSWQSEIPFACPAGVFDVGINELETKMRTGSARELTLNLELSSPPRVTEMTMNGTGWQEMTEKIIGISWFGEENDLGLLAGMNTLTNPFEELAALAAPEEAVRPIAKLLATEVLVRERGIRRLTQFSLGPSVKNKRKLLVGWQAPKAYVNEPAPAPVKVSGEIDLA